MSPLSRIGPRSACCPIEFRSPVRSQLFWNWIRPPLQLIGYLKVADAEDFRASSMALRLTILTQGRRF